MARGATDNIFGDPDTIVLEVVADGVVVSRPKDSICSVFALYWVFDIAYNKHVNKCISFLASQVCKLEVCKANVTIQRRLNLLYCINCERNLDTSAIFIQQESDISILN